MSKRRVAVLVVCAFVLAAAAAVLIVRRSHPRQVVVVCRSMAFFVVGQATPNPTITVAAGETLELTLRNEDGPGVLHDLAIDALGVATGLVQPGQTSVMTFTAPDRPGHYDYYCRPHALVMRGTLDVVAR